MWNQYGSTNEAPYCLSRELHPIILRLLFALLLLLLPAATLFHSAVRWSARLHYITTCYLNISVHYRHLLATFCDGIMLLRRLVPTHIIIMHTASSAVHPEEEEGAVKQLHLTAQSN